MSEKSRKKIEEDINIRVKLDTHFMLIEIGKKNETFDQIIRRVLQENKTLREENEKLRGEIETLTSREGVKKKRGLRNLMEGGRS